MPVTVLPLQPNYLRLVSILTAALLLLGTGFSHASVVFNWPDAGWTAGTPSPGQTDTQNFTNFTPNDIAVSVNNNGASGSGAVWQGVYPQIDAVHTTGGFTGVDALQLVVTSESTTSSFIRTTFTFAAPATNVTFQIWDVDASSGQFADTISNIRALAVGGGTVGADSVTSAVAGFNTITGTGLGTVVVGIASASNSTNQGTIDITFNGPITQFSFDWSNSDGGLGAQAIGLGPISYAPELPETSWAAALICVLAMTTREIGKRRRSRPQAQQRPRASR